MSAFWRFATLGICVIFLSVILVAFLQLSNAAEKTKYIGPLSSVSGHDLYKSEWIHSSMCVLLVVDKLIRETTGVHAVFSSTSISTIC